jgi:cytochrome c biogenesis protein CcmG, thiol:disulfide interchange protein DsbE
MAESGFSRSSEAERQLLPPVRAGWSVWPWALLMAALVVMLALRSAFQRPPESRGEHHPAVGSKLTMLRLEPLTGAGRAVSEVDLAGKVTLMNFWGPWCGACAIEFPHLVELEKHFRGDPGFQFFSISSNFDPRDEAGLAESTAEFLKQQQADFPTYRDPQAQTTVELVQAAKIAGFGYPATVVVGKDGTIRALWIGYTPGDEKAVRQAIEKSLAERV